MPLDLAQYRRRAREAAALGAEQEPRQIGVLGVEVVEPCDVVGPGPLDDRPEKPAQPHEAVRDAWEQLERPAAGVELADGDVLAEPAVVVQEAGSGRGLAAGGLELRERLPGKGERHAAAGLLVRADVAQPDGGGAWCELVEGDDLLEDPRPRLGGLPQQAGVVIGADLWPVQVDDPVGEIQD